MDSLAINPWLLALPFGAVAFLYSSVGLAGGTSYIALLTIFGVEYAQIPTISLAMNIMVSTIGAWNFCRSKHARTSLILPFLLSSIPFAWLGGCVRLPAHVFHLLLLIFLGIVALRIYLFSSFKPLVRPGRTAGILLSLAIGAGLGFISGALGLGGGIYLIPLVVILGLGEQKEAAACGTFFIWVNSVAGLGARLGHHPLPPLATMLPLLASVAVCGYAGSFLGANRFSPRTMQRTLGVVVIIAMGFLIRKMW